MNYNSSIKLFFIALILFFASVFSAYSYPDKLPEWNKLRDYHTKKIKIGKTTIQELDRICPKLLEMSKIDGYRILYEEPNDSNFRMIRYGFMNNTLSWIEFELRKKVKISKILENYGKPDSLITNHNDKFNYYDYYIFNLVSDKKNNYASAFTVYEEAQLDETLQKIINKIPNYNAFNFFRDFIPGKTLESEFKELVPNISSKEKDSKSIYRITSDQFPYNEFYQSISFNFKNGILNFISLSPRKLSLSEVQKNYGKPTKKIKLDDNVSIYEFENFAIQVDEKTEMVLNIGIVSTL